MSVWQPLIVCAVSDTTDPNYALFSHMCGFSDLIVLARNLITDMIVVSTITVALVFMWAGLKLIASQGNPAALGAAKKSLMSVVKGYVVILVAWVIVYTILNALVGPAYSLLGTP